MSPIHFGACVGAIYSEGVTQKLLPVTSAVTIANGAMGFFYHARGIKRRSGGLKHWLYNVLYGPPIFAPLLFSACGLLGVLACVLRPGYKILSQRKYWDATTRQVVEDRVYNVPKIRFFNEIEALTMTAVTDRILPQDDRLPEFRIPIVNCIDERLYKDEGDGYRFDNMPADREAYQLALRGIDGMAQQIYSKPFVDLEPMQRDHLLKSLHEASRPQTMRPGKRFLWSACGTCW